MLGIVEQPTSQNVLLIGATGQVGKSLLPFLQTKYQVAVLMRPKTFQENPDKVKALEDAKVVVRQGDLTDEESLVAALKGITVVVSCAPIPGISLQFTLIKAMKRVGHIKRFVPSDFGSDVRIEPDFVPSFREKLELHQALFESGIPYTIIDNGPWMVFGAGKFGNPLNPDFSLSPQEIRFMGSGDSPIITQTLEDNSRLTAEIVADDRTINKRVMVDVNVTSQKQLVESWVRVGGPRPTIGEPITEEEVMKLIEQATDPRVNFGLRIMRNVHFHDGLKRTDDYLSTTELYPEVTKQCLTVEQYYAKILSDLRKQSA
ncbi:hypothetical protein BZG36_04376 [Bifiguratus adelaidae]|uniref:NmrA-like domain-containing protein n=1 Tax=Bifiguratus adelaidae TaxID=1938954 RepID=A0A261XVH7_9FUNG|nr:hypothetical protein BZG36_04376 [Bifiguratus adelaidae]